LTHRARDLRGPKEKRKRISRRMNGGADLTTAKGKAEIRKNVPRRLKGGEKKVSWKSQSSLKKRYKNRIFDNYKTKKIARRREKKETGPSKERGVIGRRGIVCGSCENEQEKTVVNHEG